MSLFKQIAAKLPSRLQLELKRIHFGRQIRKGSFVTSEPEFKILNQFVKPGDWVIDIGANVGHYTKRFAELVGENGRVIAIEPVPTTFSLLAANVQLFDHNNVTLINAAVSNKLGITGMDLPKFSTGLTNFYRAHLTSAGSSALSVLTMPLDSLCIEQRTSLIKIDTEGHELFVLKGMEKLIKLHRPVLIIETESKEVEERLSLLGYVTEKLSGSPNILFRPRDESEGRTSGSV